MLGVLLGVAVGGFKAGKSLYTKTAATRTDDYLTAWATRAVSVVVLAGALLAVADVPALGSDFWWALPLQTVLFSILTILSTRAFRVGDLSLIAPLFALTPVLVIGTSALILGEHPPLLALVGIGCITVGAYALNLRHADRGALEPIRALAYDRGARYAFAAILISAVLPPIDKLGLQASAPVFWATSVHLCVAVVLAPVAYYMQAETSEWTAHELRPLVLAGVFNAGLWIAQTLAYQHTLVVYVTALKRLNILLTVGFGYHFFNEAVTDRLVGATLIVLGSLLILAGQHPAVA